VAEDSAGTKAAAEVHRVARVVAVVAGRAAGARVAEGPVAEGLEAGAQKVVVDVRVADAMVNVAAGLAGAIAEGRSATTSPRAKI